MAKIYQIVGDNGIYIGSTTQLLKYRFTFHKSIYNPCISKQLINPKIELIEEVNEDERYTREQYWIDNTNCINKKRALKLPFNNCCECGGRYTRQNKTTHFKTTKHLNHINNIG